MLLYIIEVKNYHRDYTLRITCHVASILEGTEALSCTSQLVIVLSQEDYIHQTFAFGALELVIQLNSYTDIARHLLNPTNLSVIHLEIFA